jgi:hypothetical protein
MVHRLMRIFCENGSVCNQKNSRSPAVLRGDALEHVRLSPLQPPPSTSKSVTKLCKQSTSLGSAYKATQLPNLRAYRIHVIRELRPTTMLLDSVTAVGLEAWFVTIFECEI